MGPVTTAQGSGARGPRGRRTALALALLLAVAGVLHLVAPGIFESIVPPVLGPPAPWVVVSGLAELACATGLAVPRTRGAAGWATAVLFVVVFPANVQMAVDALQGDGSVAVALLRLPLQVPLVAGAVHVARSARPAAVRTPDGPSSVHR